MKQLNPKAEIKKFIGIFFVTAICFSALFSFQNCSGPTEVGGTNDSVDQESLGTSGPFAYDTTIDHLAHMTCSGVGTSYNKNAFFTFRVGAYNSGSGLGWNKAYHDQIKYLPLPTQMENLRGARTHLGTQIQLSVRRLNRYNDGNMVSLAGSGTPAQLRDYDTALGALDSEKMLQYVLNLSSSSRMHFAKYNKGLDNRLLEMSLSFPDKNHMEINSARATFEESGRNAVLAVAYSQGSPQTLVSPDEADQEWAYGRAFQLSFTHGHKLNNPNEIYQTRDNLSAYQRLVLGSVTEYDMATGTPTGANWICPTNQAYMVVRQQDVDNKVDGAENCDTTAKGISMDSSYLAVRNVLRIEDWAMDTSRRCIVAKQAGDLCYEGANPSFQRDTIVNYNGTYANGQCGLNVKVSLDIDDDGENESVTVLCPAYVSVCRRF